MRTEQRNLDNDRRPIVHLNVPGEVAGGVEEGLNDLVRWLVAVCSNHVERASQTELVAVRGEGFQDAVGEEKDEVPWRQRDRCRTGKVRVWKQTERHGGAREDRLLISFAVEDVARVVPGAAVDQG